jgi:hypothetical protein
VPPAKRSTRSSNGAGPSSGRQNSGPQSQGQQQAPPARGAFEVDLPAGGRFKLNDADEVQLWEESAKAYISDYGLTKANDLMLLGAILSQGVAMYRAQQDLADPKKASSAVKTIGQASEQIRELEKALGIDKKSREAGGQHTIADYVARIKLAAHEKGVRISERTLAFEAFVMELRWKLRVLANGDTEDKRYMLGQDPEGAVLAWATQQVEKLEEDEKKWAEQKGRVFVGRV